MSDFKGSEYVFSNNYNWKDILSHPGGPGGRILCVRSGIGEKLSLSLRKRGHFPVIEALIQDVKGECPFQMHGIVKENERCWKPSSRTVRL